MRSSIDRQVVYDDGFATWFKDNYSETNKYLYILGIGFDDRMCDGIERFCSTSIPFDVWTIKYDEGERSPSKEYEDKVNHNVERLNRALKQAMVTHVETKHIKLWKEDEVGTLKQENNQSRYVGEINASKMVKNSQEELKQYSDIIVDVSALPQTIYLCIINTLFKASPESQRINIVVSENYTTDMLIEATQAEETAHEIQGYSSPSDDLDCVTIWYPILGESNNAFLEKYSNFLKSHSHDIDEICPVVPFPSVDIRRADTILSAYSKKLFADWGIEKNNIIYASETNPILICKNLVEASESYRIALSPLGNSKFVFSAITSKLMTVGMLLAAFDMKTSGFSVSVLGISNKGYQVRKHGCSDTQNKLTCLAV